jgi:hypothetical protein
MFRLFKIKLDIMSAKNVEEYWTNMSIEDRTKFLKDHNCWEGINTYLWKYVPTQVKAVIEEEFEKSR